MGEGSLLEKVDWIKVSEKIDAYGLRDLDAESCLRNVVVAAKEYLPKDGKKRLLSVEREYRWGGLKGVSDLLLLEDEDGSKEVIDWKTTGSLSSSWERRYSNSWQGPWYAYVAGPGVKKVTFRGVERGTGKLRECLVPITEESLQTLESNAEDTLNLRYSSLAGPIRRGGYACVDSFGECPYYGDRCLSTDVFRDGEWGKLVSSLLSPTSAERIWQCPHKNTLYQIDKLRGNVPDMSSDASIYGNAFHAGIAVVYEVLG